MRTNLEDVFRKPYWRETGARVAIEAWKSSGLSVREFCRRTGIDSGRIRRWAATLDGKSPRVPDGPVEFHPVRVVGRQLRELEIRLTLDGGRSVSIPEGFDVEYLSLLLDAIERRA